MQAATSENVPSSSLIRIFDFAKLHRFFMRTTKTGCPDAQADLSLPCAHMSIGTFSHVAVQLLIKCSCVVNSIAFSARIFLVKSTNDKKKKKKNGCFCLFFFGKQGLTFHANWLPKKNLQETSRTVVGFRLRWEEGTWQWFQNVVCWDLNQAVDWLQSPVTKYLF